MCRPYPSHHGRRGHAQRARFERTVSLTRPGAFNGGIFLVRDVRYPSSVYVEKCIKPADLSNGFAEREVRALRNCDHRNITQFIHYEVSTDPRNQAPIGRLIMQHCELGDLERLINQCRRTGYVLPEHFLWSVFRDMSLALCHLRTGRDATSDAIDGYNIDQRPDWRPIIHHDVKPQNILLTWRGQGPYPRAVLADFGCSKIEGHTPRHQGNLNISRFDPEFAPPEVPWGYKSDVFSLGLAMHCLARRITAPIRGPARRDPTGERYSDALRYSVDRCLDHDLTTRISARDLPAAIFRRQARFVAGNRRQRPLPSELFHRRNQ